MNFRSRAAVKKQPTRALGVTRSMDHRRRNFRRRDALMCLIGASLLGACRSMGARTAPDFVLRSTDGDEVQLSELRGRVVLLHFFDSKDRWTRMLLPRLALIDEAYRDEGLSVLGVSLDGPKTVAAVGAIARQRNVTFPVLLDETTEVAALYNPSRIVPYGVIIARDGAIWGHWNGFHPGEMPALREALERALVGDDKLE